MFLEGSETFISAILAWCVKIKALDYGAGPEILASGIHYPYLPRRGYCVETSEKTCSSVHPSVRPSVRTYVTKSGNRTKSSSVWNVCRAMLTISVPKECQNSKSHQIEQCLERLPCNADDQCPDCDMVGWWIKIAWVEALSIVASGPPLPCGCYLVLN